MEENEPYLGYYPEAELVFALVAPLGADYRPLVEALNDSLGDFGYKSHLLRLSEYFPVLCNQLGLEWNPPVDGRQSPSYKIQIGNQPKTAVLIIGDANKSGIFY